MAERTLPLRERGFSLVEMLVALVFTGLLMAGMSQVFKASLSSFYTSGEQLSSARRNRMSVDILYDDLNSAAMYLADLSSPPTQVSSGNPAFYILPNQAVTGAGPDDPATADELYFYLDQPLAFEGSISAAGNSAAEIINTGGVAAVSDSSFTVDCGDPSYAAQVKVGQTFIIKDSWESLYVNTVTPSGKVVTVTVVGSPSAGITGIGSPGAPSKFKHIPGSRVLFFTPGQMVKYSIQMKNLDPQVPGGIPCLVRDQGAYSPGGFVADQPQSTITENVSGFKVYLSANSGASWAGTSVTGAGFSAGWNGPNGIRAALNTQLATAGRTDYQTTAGNEQWFRKIPTLVRIDLTTRTAVKRSEYSTTGTTQAYKNIQQSLVIVPRHFGLPLN